MRPRASPPRYKARRPASHPGSECAASEHRGDRCHGACRFNRDREAPCVSMRSGEYFAKLVARVISLSPGGRRSWRRLSVYNWASSRRNAAPPPNDRPGSTPPDHHIPGRGGTGAQTCQSPLSDLDRTFWQAMLAGRETSSEGARRQTVEVDLDQQMPYIRPYL